MEMVSHFPLNAELAVIEQVGSVPLAGPVPLQLVKVTPDPVGARIEIVPLPDESPTS
jgi:hypothetical protein